MRALVCLNPPVGDLEDVSIAIPPYLPALINGHRANSPYRRRRRRASGRLHELVPADDWCFLKGHYDGRTMTTAGVLPFPADRTSSHTTPREELGKHLGKDHGVLGLLLSPLVIQA